MYIVLKKIQTVQIKAVKNNALYHLWIQNFPPERQVEFCEYYSKTV